MATVNKNFRIKNGLVVEGSTATVNGQNVLTETGGDSYILNLVGGATLVKSVSSDFAVDGAGNLTINGSSDLARTGDITTAINALDTDDIEEGTTNKYFTNQRALDATASAYDASGAAAQALSDAEDYTDNQLTNYTTTANLDTTIDGYGYLKSADLSGYATESYVDTAIGNIDLTYTTDDVTEGSNLYFTNQRVDEHIFGGQGIDYYQGQISVNIGTGIDFEYNGVAIDRDTVDTWYDASGAASTAEANANTYTDNAINALDTDDIEEGTSNLYFTNTRARGAISAGTGISYDSGTGVVSVDNTIATQSYVDNAIDNLVDGAPGLLDTLNEIAAAINDDANYFTTVANSIAAKQDTLTAGSNIDITSNTISVTGLDTDDVAEGTNLYFTDSRARSAVDGTDRSFTSLEINEVSKEVAATTGNIATAAATTAYSWLKADYRSAKFLVKIKNGSHTEVSEVLVTLDTSDNVYLTEYGMSSTSGTSLGTISADVSGNDVRIRVTPANNNSEVMVAGSLLI